MKTNLGKEFFKILRKCFPQTNPLSKIFNQNSVKLSYSCLPSIGKVISWHNKKILRGVEPTPPCNCTVYDCVVDGKCQEKGVIYQCKIKETQGENVESYVGLTERTFKDRLTKHRTSINRESYHRNPFSKHI